MGLPRQPEGCRGFLLPGPFSRDVRWFTSPPPGAAVILFASTTMRTALPVIAAALMTALAAQAGDIYRWKTADGVWHYSDQPIAGAERVSSGKHVQPLETQAGRTPATPAATPAPTAGKGATDRVRDDVAADKAAKCKDAQANYQQTIIARRLYKQGPKGEQIYLTDEEIDAARVTARTNMEYYCGK